MSKKRLYSLQLETKVILDSEDESKAKSACTNDYSNLQWFLKSNQFFKSANETFIRDLQESKLFPKTFN